ncbi:MAG: nucleotidyltransferase family protein [Pseudomonadota bacterium]
MTKPVLGAVLAAGESVRFGSPKQALTIDGDTLLARAVKRLTAATGEAPLVVIGARADAAQEWLDGLACVLAVNPRWRDGMGTSLALAASLVPSRVAGLLVTVADMPDISVNHYRGLIEAFQTSPTTAVAAAYPNGVGVPAIIPAADCPELAKHDGQSGARQWLRRCGAQAVVELGDAARDIDTPQDWASFVKRP